MKKSKVLVTGAKGFVGSEIVRFLEREYEQVFTIENEKTLQNDKIRQISDNAFAADITDRESVLRLEKIGALDFLVHSAGLAHQFGATSREHFQKVNVTGTANVLELAGKLGIKHFILISSVSVYGQANKKGESVWEEKSKEMSTEVSILEPETEPKEKPKEKSKEESKINSVSLEASTKKPYARRKIFTPKVSWTARIWHGDFAEKTASG
jgi:nucleoside-diphosphate-sugar epimerase